ncbi:hypothetical protein WN51_11268 [Melipona quadrifasciata]|uniref:Uncharacterized protein n=1 Tax=Melipona quadrifasciata TaxID=166423 RepID=A0A0M8ZMR6_9HYME|nr:hypothetical protein WN51_11268 [Melipona quadrifasciata]
MTKQLTPEKAIDIIWFSVVLSFCWPLPSISQLVIQTTICVINHDSLQYVVKEMLNCIKEAQQYEKEIYNKLIAKSSIFFGSSMVCVYLTSTAFLIGPIFMPVPFPCDAEYPFRVNNTPMHVIIYVQQSIVSYQCAAHLCLSMFGALLLWFTAARFECLAIEMRQITNTSMLIVCVKKQLHLRRYAEKVVGIFRFIVLYAVGVSTFILTLCGIILLMDTPLIVKIQFIVVSFTVLTEIYIYTWPADYMKDMSIHISWSAYDIMWYKQTLKMQKDLLKVLIYQEPIILSVRCIIPELSLRYYCSFGIDLGRIQDR